MALDMLGLAGLALTSVIVLFVVWLVIASFFVWFGVKVAGVDSRKRTWGNAIMAVILMLVLSFLLGYVGGTIGFVLGIIGAIAIIKYIYTTSWGKAIIAWVFMVIAVIIVGVVLGIGVLGLAFLG